MPLRTELYPQPLPLGTMQHRSPGVEGRRKRKRYYHWAQSQEHNIMDRLEERGEERGRVTTIAYRAEESTPPIAWRRGAKREEEALPLGTEPRKAHHQSPGGKGRRKWKRHCLWAQSQEHNIMDRLEERGEERGRETTFGHRAKDSTPSSQRRGAVS